MKKAEYQEELSKICRVYFEPFLSNAGFVSCAPFDYCWYRLYHGVLQHVFLVSMDADYAVVPALMCGSHDLFLRLPVPASPYMRTVQDHCSRDISRLMYVGSPENTALGLTRHVLPELDRHVSPDIAYQWQKQFYIQTAAATKDEYRRRHIPVPAEITFGGISDDFIDEAILFDDFADRAFREKCAAAAQAFLSMAEENAKTKNELLYARVRVDALCSDRRDAFLEVIEQRREANRKYLQKKIPLKQA